MSTLKPAEKKKLIRVVVIEDSPMMAETIARGLQANPKLTVVGTAHDGETGRAIVARLKPDVVTLDINMPGMDGLTCLQYIMIEQPTPCVVVSAITGQLDMETFEAYELGAVDVVEKPRQVTANSMTLFKRRLAAKVIRASYADVGHISRAILARDSDVHPDRVPLVYNSAISPGMIPHWLLVIGSSTGGPRTLMDIIPRLPSPLGAAVIVVQHMPGSFTGSFADRLNEYSELNVKEAQEGELLLEDTVYITPGDYHLYLRRGSAGYKSYIKLSKDPKDAVITPSADVTLSSALEIFGNHMIGTIITGLGSDGAKGMAQLYAAGCVTIAESEESAVIYGMPKSVVEMGVATHICHAQDISRTMVRELNRIKKGKG